MKYLILAVAIAMTGCASKPRTYALPVQSVAIAPFSCNCDESTRRAVEDTILKRVFNETRSQVIRGEEADIVIHGTIVMATGVSAQASLKSLLSFSSVQNRSEGTYVSGITLQAFKKQTMVASEGIGQNLGSGELISPIRLAQDVIDDLISSLSDKGLIEEK